MKFSQILGLQLIPAAAVLVTLCASTSAFAEQYISTNGSIAINGLVPTNPCGSIAINGISYKLKIGQNNIQGRAENVTCSTSQNAVTISASFVDDSGEEQCAGALDLKMKPDLKVIEATWKPESCNRQAFKSVFRSGRPGPSGFIQPL